MGPRPPDEATSRDNDGASSHAAPRLFRPGEHMARPEKVAVVAEIREKFAGSDAAVLAEYRGLKVGELAELRGALRPADTEFKIFKNTLARRAAEEAGLTDLVPMLLGPTAIAFVKGDAVIAAKALRDFAKTHDALILKGGLLGDRTLVPGDIADLADVPPREVLLARLAGGFQAPLTKAAGLFQAFTRNMAYGVKALIDQRIEGGEALEVPAEPEPEPVPEAAAEPEAPAAEAAAPEAEAAAEEAPAEEAAAPEPEAPAAEAETTETASTETASTETETTEGE
jgi:large subunit ribosomal protein L10